MLLSGERELTEADFGPPPSMAEELWRDVLLSGEIGEVLSEQAGAQDRGRDRAGHHAGSLRRGDLLE